MRIFKCQDSSSLTGPRFLYIRILLLRPTLLSAAQNRYHLSKRVDLGQLKLEEHLALKVCGLCISTVHTLVTHLNENLDAVYRSLGWRTVHCQLLPFRSNESYLVLIDEWLKFHV